MIDILLPCYNGERYISEQIDSILTQTYQEFTLYINDDCSTDQTYKIVKQYEKKHPDKIIVSRNNENLGSAQAAFMKMMLSHKENYIMLSDQDDVWHSDKIENSYALMRQIEQEKGAAIPVLVHADICVVDEYLEEEIASYKSYMKSNVDKKPLSRLLIQNAVTGCTVMYNKALADYIREIPEHIIMHDWWLMLVAGAFGEICFLPKVTLKYRQHKSNVEGMAYIRSLKYKVHKLIYNTEIRESLEKTYKQSKSFMEVYEDELPAEFICLIKEYCRLPDKNKFQKWKTIFRFGYFKDGVIRNLAFLIFV